MTDENEFIPTEPGMPPVDVRKRDKRVKQQLNSWAVVFPGMALRIEHEPTKPIVKLRPTTLGTINFAAAYCELANGEEVCFGQILPGDFLAD